MMKAQMALKVVVLAVMLVCLGVASVPVRVQAVGVDEARGARMAVRHLAPEQAVEGESGEESTEESGEEESHAEASNESAAEASKEASESAAEASNKSAAESTAESTAEASKEASESAAEASNESAAEASNESTENTAEASKEASESAAEASNESTNESTTESTAESSGAEESASDPGEDTSSEEEEVLADAASEVKRRVVKEKEDIRLNGKEEVEAAHREAAKEAADKQAQATKVASTLNNLGKVLETIHEQVEADEQVFRAFKNKVLQEEVARADVDLSWPAIKDLVRSEVAVGRHKIENQVANFKVDILDVIQKGLDSLRADLRATISTGFELPAEDGKRVPRPAVASLRTNHTAAARASEKRTDAADKGGTVDDDVIDHKVFSKDTANANDEEDQYERKNLYANKQLRKVEQDLQGQVSPHDLEAIRGVVAKKMKTLQKAELNLERPVDDYGETALEALRTLKVELAGKLSNKDMKAELFQALEDLTHEHLKAPSPETRDALKRLQETLIAELNKNADQALPELPDLTPEDKAKLVKPGMSVAQRLEALTHKAQELANRRLAAENDSMDFAEHTEHTEHAEHATPDLPSTESSHPSAPADDRIITEALDAESPEAHAQDMQQANEGTQGGRVVVEADIASPGLQ